MLNFFHVLFSSILDMLKTNYIPYFGISYFQLWVGFFVACFSIKLLHFALFNYFDNFDSNSFLSPKSKKE